MSIRDSIKRLFGRQPPPRAPQRRYFEAARNDDLTFGWQSLTAAADADIGSALERLRGRSRNLANNNDYARKYLQQVEVNVVGPAGFSLQVTAHDGARLDKLANSLIEAEFWRWSRRGVCEVSGQLSLVELESVVAKTVARDGEALVRIVRGKRAGNPHQFALQLLDIDRLPIGYNATLGNGHRIVMGIEINPYSRPVAYHLHRNHPGALHGQSDEGRYERVPATDIMHLFRASRPEQRRGVPEMHSAMLRMEMLGKFDLAAMVAARKGAETIGFFKSATGEAPKLDGVSDDGNQVSTSVPGSYDTLPEGFDFIAHDTKYPSDVYGTFVKSALRGIASGLGVSYNSLASDLEGVNYSSIRAGVLEERDNWMIWQGWMIEALMRPIYEGWLEAALLAGAIKTPTGQPLPATKLDKFLSHHWQGRRWAWVDPLKDVNANIAAIDAGLKSRREVIAEQGRDIEEVWTQLQAEADMAESMGLSLGAEPVVEAAEEPEDEPVTPSA
jgi:lambda family phage portal protein